MNSAEAHILAAQFEIQAVRYSAYGTYEQDPFNYYTLLLVCPPAPSLERATEAPLEKGCLLGKHPSCEPSQGGQGGCRGARSCRSAVTRPGGSSQPQHAAFHLCLPFQRLAEGERRQAKHLRSSTPMAILPLLPAKFLPPHIPCCYPEVNR